MSQLFTPFWIFSTFDYIVEREKGLKCPQFEKLPDSAPFSRGFKVFLF